MNWLKNIQEAPDDERTRAAIVMGIIATIIVAAIWLAYFNTLFATENKISKAEDIGEFSFSKTMKSRAANVYESMKRGLGGMFGASRSYEINP